MPSIITFLIILAAGGGIYVVAEQARPGDALYPFKVNVNEEVRSGLAVSNQAQISWDIRRAERRFNEIEELAASGQLDTVARAELESRLAATISNIEMRIVELQENDPDAAAHARTRFEATLQTHQEILESLAAGSNAGRAQFDALIAIVQNGSLLISAESETNSTSTAARSDNGKRTESAARGKLEAAAQVLESSRRMFNRVKNDISTEQRTAIEAKFNAAGAAIGESENLIESGSYGEAFIALGQSMQSSQEARLIALAHIRAAAASQNGEKDESPETESDPEEGEEHATTSNQIEVGGSIKVEL